MNLIDTVIIILFFYIPVSIVMGSLVWIRTGEASSAILVISIVTVIMVAMFLTMPTPN